MGVGLPALVLVRVIAATFYARGDTATPARATVLAVLVNIAMKFLLVWGVGLGAVGVALGTSLGTWANVALLCSWRGRRTFCRSIVILRARFRPSCWRRLATGAAALGGVLPIRWPHLGICDARPFLRPPSWPAVPPMC